MIGWILNKKVSVCKINGFIKKNNIDLNKYENVEYKSFNDFFIYFLLNCANN